MLVKLDPRQGAGALISAHLGRICILGIC